MVRTVSEGGFVTNWEVIFTVNMYNFTVKN